MSDETPMYGWFSKKHKESGHTTHLYRKPDGTEVEVSSISKSDTESPLGWDDSVCRGRVTTHIRGVNNGMLDG